MTGLIKAMRYKALQKNCRKSGLMLEKAFPEVTKAQCSRCNHDVALNPSSAAMLQIGFAIICYSCWKPGDWDRALLVTTSDQAAELDRIDAVMKGAEASKKAGNSVQ